MAQSDLHRMCEAAGTTVACSCVTPPTQPCLRCVFSSCVWTMCLRSAATQVPTTRALCCVGTGDQVLRDMFYNGDAKFEPGAVVCRVSPSFVRFGTFQLPVSRGGVQAGLTKLTADYGEG